MRNSIAIAAVAAAVAALLIGGWFLLKPAPGGTATGSSGSGPAPTTELAWPSYPYGPPSTGAPEPYPTIPSAQVRTESQDAYGSTRVRTARDGRQLLLPVVDSDCMAEEVRLLGQHPDRVDVEIRNVAKPPPPSVSVAPDGSYGCLGISNGAGQGPHAAIDLTAPLGQRTVVIHRER